MAKGDSSKLWSMFSVVAALGAAVVARKGIDKYWQVSTGKKPPENPADPDIEIWEAVAWATLTGAAVSLARMYAQRRAAAYYVKTTGKLPPTLRQDGE